MTSMIGTSCGGTKVPESRTVTLISLPVVTFHAFDGVHISGRFARGYHQGAGGVRE